MSNSVMQNPRLVELLVQRAVDGLNSSERAELTQLLSEDRYVDAGRFEYTAALKKKPEVDALAALSPAGVDASRFLRTHSGLGSEVGHVDDMIDLVAVLKESLAETGRGGKKPARKRATSTKKRPRKAAA